MLGGLRLAVGGFRLRLANINRIRTIQTTKKVTNLSHLGNGDKSYFLIRWRLTLSGASLNPCQDKERSITGGIFKNKIMNMRIVNNQHKRNAAEWG